MLFERGLALVFKDEDVVACAADGSEGGVDDTVAGIEEDFGRGEGVEVGGGGREDAVVEAVVAGGVTGEAARDGSGPEDEPAFVIGFVVESGRPGVDGRRFVGENIQLLVRAPVDQVG
jgi:hypothetical protein